MLWLHIFHSVTDKGAQSSNEPIFTRAAKYLLTIDILLYGQLYKCMQPSSNKDFKMSWIKTSIWNFSDTITNANN